MALSLMVKLKPTKGNLNFTKTCMTLVVVHQNIQGVPLHDFFKLDTLHYLHWALLRRWSMLVHQQSSLQPCAWEDVWKFIYILCCMGGECQINKKSISNYHHEVMLQCRMFICYRVFVKLYYNMCLHVANILFVTNEHQSQQILNGMALQNWLEIGNHSPDPMLVWKGEGHSILTIILNYWYTMVMKWGEWNNTDFSNW